MSYPELVNQAGKYLAPDEPVLATLGGTCRFSAVGHDRSVDGVLLATDRRLLFYGKTLFGFVLSETAYSQLSTIQLRKQFTWFSVLFASPGSSLTMNGVQSGSATEFIAVVRQRMAAMSTQGLVAAIEGLATLRDRHLLTDQEFELKKKLLLGIAPSKPESAQTKPPPNREAA